MASTTQKKLLLINGPNLNLLGTREPETYGSTTLEQITSAMTERASALNIELLHFQSNHEGGIIDRLHEARTEGISGIIINPAAYTHTSIAIRDALLGINIPFLELHISNVHTREAFRHHSYFSDKAQAVIVGLGVFGYVAALEWWHWTWNDGKMKGIALESKC